MTMSDEIIKAEEEFFNKHLQSADTIILSPDGFAQLRWELQQDGYMDVDDLIEIQHYEGLEVAISTKDNYPNFKLALVG